MTRRTQASGIPPALQDDSPAVVNCLLHRGAVSGEALPATVLDLAARGLLALEELAPRELLCRLRGDAETASLDPYERSALALLESRAVGGTVPADALCVGVLDEQDRWWRMFSNDVRRTASKEYFGVSGQWGLVGSLTPLGWTLAVLVVAAFGVALLTPSLLFGTLAWVVGLVVAGGFAVRGGSRFGLSYRNRVGRQRVRDWRDVRQRLAAGDFEDVSAAGVTLWGRDLAYAAALGMGRTACRGLPFGVESASSTWVRRAGLWHPARVRYPRRIPPGWGRRPRQAAAIGVTGLLGAAAVLIVAATSGAWSMAPPFSTAVAHAVGDPKPVLVGIVVVLGLMSGWELWAAITDLVRAPRRVEGVVVGRWVRHGGRFNPWGDLVPLRWYVAVDDGSASTIRGWRTSRHELESVQRGEPVSAEVTARLGYVRDLESR